MQKFKLDDISGDYGHHCQEKPARRAASGRSCVQQNYPWTHIEPVGWVSGTSQSPHAVSIWSPALSLGQRDQKATGGSSAKNLVGSPTFSESGCAGYAIRPSGIPSSPPSDCHLLQRTFSHSPQSPSHGMPSAETSRLRKGAPRLALSPVGSRLVLGTCEELPQVSRLRCRTRVASVG